MKRNFILICFLMAILPLSLIAQLTKGGECIDGDCENGKGVVQFQDGSIYEGKFKNKQLELTQESQAKFV